jgi:hypothetical protein
MKEIIEALKDPEVKQAISDFVQKQADKDTRDLIEISHRRFVDKWEKMFAYTIKKFWRRQCDEILARMDSLDSTKEFMDLIMKGGPGSGNFGHAGRPGKRGGSSSGGSFRSGGVTFDPHKENDEIKALKEMHKDVTPEKVVLSKEQVKRYTEKYDFNKAQQSTDWKTIQSIEKSTSVPPCILGGKKDKWYVMDGWHRIAVVAKHGGNKILAYFDPGTVKHLEIKGGPGSGNFGHAGRPGQRGGSAPTSMVFHGTSLDAAKKISVEGIKESAYGGVYASYSKRESLSYALTKAKEVRADGKGDGKEAVVVVVNSKVFDPSGSNKGSYVLRRDSTVPAKAIVRIEIYKTQDLQKYKDTVSDTPMRDRDSVPYPKPIEIVSGRTLKKEKSTYLYMALVVQNKVKKEFVQKASDSIWTFGKYTWDKEAEDEGRALLKKIVVERGKEVMKELPVIGISFEQDYPEVDEWVDSHAYRFSFDMNEETERMLRDSMMEGFNAGESMPKLADRVRAVFADMEAWRALRIARTETIRASNYGAETAYIKSGVVEYKEWLTAHDERLCEFCSYFNGRTYPVGGLIWPKGEPLEVITGEEGELTSHIMKMDYEDIKAPPLHPNCRCTLVPVVFEKYKEPPPKTRGPNKPKVEPPPPLPPPTKDRGAGLLDDVQKKAMAEFDRMVGDIPAGWENRSMDRKNFVKAFQENSQIRMKRWFNEESWRNVLETGLIKNQFETRTSSGAHCPYKEGSRDIWERIVFNGAYQGPAAYKKLKKHEYFPTELAKQRPKYAFVTDKRYGYTRNAEQYGGTELVLKPHMKERSTITQHNTSGVENVKKEGATFRNPTNLYYGYHNDKKPFLSAQSSSYNEIQIHGDIDMSKDVEKIIANTRFLPRGANGNLVTKEVYIARIQALSRKFNIPVEWVNS